MIQYPLNEFKDVGINPDFRLLDVLNLEGMEETSDFEIGTLNHGLDHSNDENLSFLENRFLIILNNSKKQLLAISLSPPHQIRRKLPLVDYSGVLYHQPLDTLLVVQNEHIYVVEEFLTNRHSQIKLIDPINYNNQKPILIGMRKGWTCVDKHHIFFPSLKRNDRKANIFNVKEKRIVSSVDYNAVNIRSIYTEYFDNNNNNNNNKVSFIFIGDRDGTLSTGMVKIFSFFKESAKLSLHKSISLGCTGFVYSVNILQIKKQKLLYCSTNVGTVEVYKDYLTDDIQKICLINEGRFNRGGNQSLIYQNKIITNSRVGSGIFELEINLENNNKKNKNNNNRLRSFCFIQELKKKKGLRKSTFGITNKEEENKEKKMTNELLWSNSSDFICWLDDRRKKYILSFGRINPDGIIYIWENKKWVKREKIDGQAKEDLDERILYLRELSFEDDVIGKNEEERKKNLFSVKIIGSILTLGGWKSLFFH